MKISISNTFLIFLFLSIFVFLGSVRNIAHADLGDFNFTGHWLDNDLTNRMRELGKLQRKIDKREAIMGDMEVDDDAEDDNETSKGKGNFHFHYDPTISPLVREREINALIEMGRKVGVMNAEKENLLKTTFGQMDIMKTIGGALQAKGHSPHSLATALAYWLVSHLQIVHDTHFTDQQLAAVVNQVEQQLKNADTVMSNDAEKQMAAEHLMWMATFQLLSYQDARQTGATARERKAVADASREMMRAQFNMDADKIMIGDKGLMPK